MRVIVGRLVTMVTLYLVALPLLALAMGQPETSVLLTAGVAALLVAAVIAGRYLAVLVTATGPALVRPGGAREDAARPTPAPKHPGTAGRPSPRAPGRSVAVT